MTRERVEILILWGLLAVAFGCGVALVKDLFFK
jgi:LPS O-antigen subunit length determinant protein (WzzB/FepE family)